MTLLMSVRGVHYAGTAIRRRSDYIIGFVTPAIGPNKVKKLTRIIAPVHNIQSLNMALQTTS